MTNKKSTGEEIGKLIDKLRKDWARAEVSENQISRIDKDIIISNLRELYDLVYDLGINGHTEPPPVPESETIEEKEETLPVPPQMAASGLPTRQPDEEHQNKEEEVIPDNKKEEIKPEDEKEEKTGDAPPYEPRAREPLNKKIDTPSKATADLFTPSKTLSDVYKSNHDNSLAAKINQNRIEDIRSAIGLNDKFLMINHIFGGEMSKYNHAIDKLNKYNHFHEALQYIEELKSGPESSEKEAACNKLLEIVKRKFH